MALWDEKKQLIFDELCGLVRRGEVESVGALEDAFTGVASDVLGLPEGIVEAAVGALSGEARKQLRNGIGQVWNNCQKAMNAEDVDRIERLACTAIQIKAASGQPVSYEDAFQLFVQVYKQQTGIDLREKSNPAANAAMARLQDCVARAKASDTSISWGSAGGMSFGRILALAAGAYVGYRVLR